MNIPIILILAWITLELGFVCALHGKPKKGKYNALHMFIAWFGLIIMLLWSVGWTLQ